MTLFPRLLFVLLPVLAMAPVAAARDEFLIHRAEVNEAAGQINIFGVGFGEEEPDVTLESTPVVVVAHGPTQIVVTMPAGTTPGTYLLSVYPVENRREPGTFHVTVGAEGPEGPQGVPGPAGPAGDTGLPGPMGPTGDTGPQGQPGPAGTTGQSSTSAYGTGPLTLNPSDATFILVPGMTQTVNVPAGSIAYVSSDGGLQNSSTTATAYSMVDVALFVDGSLPPDAAYKRIVAANTSTLSQMFAYWSFHLTLSLAPGNHTFEVRARVVTPASAAATVGGNNTTVLQGALTVTTIKL